MQETDKLFDGIVESQPCLLGINATAWANITANDRIPSQEELAQFWTSISFMRSKEIKSFDDAILIISDRQLEEVFMAYSKNLIDKKKKND